MLLWEDENFSYFSLVFERVFSNLFFVIFRFPFFVQRYENKGRKELGLFVFFTPSLSFL